MFAMERYIGGELPQNRNQAATLQADEIPQRGANEQSRLTFSACSVKNPRKGISMIQNEGSNLDAIMLTWIYEAHALITRTDSCGKSAVMWHGKPFQRKTWKVHTSFHLISLLTPSLASLTPCPPTQARIYSLEIPREYANR